MGCDSPGRDRAGAARVFGEHRDVLLAVAYRVLGRVTDAEDVVQEAWLRWDRADRAAVADPRAYLVTTTTRLAIDRLRRVQARREAPVALRLVEPLLTAPDVAEEVELAESVSLALLVVLETLSPLERAVFVLREAFDCSHAEIAELLGRSEPAVRQLARRARDHVRERRLRFDADHVTRRRVTERFLDACATGDLDGLMVVLAPGLTATADGRQRARLLRRPSLGAAGATRLSMAVRIAPLPSGHVLLVRPDGVLGVAVAAVDDPVIGLVVDEVDGVARTIRVVTDADQLVGVHLSNTR